MAKRSKPETVARFNEDGISMCRKADGSYELEVSGQEVLPAGQGQVRKTFDSLRSARQFARKVMQLVDEFGPRKPKGAEEAD